MYTDPIADLLTRIRNAYAARKIDVELPYSKVKEGIVGVLEKYEFIGGYSVEGEKTEKKLVIALDYREDGMPRIERVRRISRPSLRVYTKAKDLNRTRGGFGISIVSTSQGIMAASEARKQGLGGEVIAEVW